MLLLGIETSCDETAAAVVEDGCTVRSSVITSTKDVFARTGGVIPEDAARRQVECILPVLHAALSEAHITQDEVDAIAVTRGPGLLGSLLVGVTAARTVSKLWNKPLVGVHHTFGHLSSVWPDALSPPRFPCITLSVSGGHSDLWYRTAHTKGVLLGSTRDDAAGEAFDKGAAMLGLPYPGGPSIAKAAEKGDENAFAFPLALSDEDTCDFSFSGLKTSLRYTLRGAPPSETLREDLAASFQFAICRQLAERVATARKRMPKALELHIVGGVSANTRLRAFCAERFADIPIRVPVKLQYCTDNAAMIAAAGYFLLREHGEKQAFGDFETSATLALSSFVS